MIGRNHIIGMAAAVAVLLGGQQAQACLGAGVHGGLMVGELNNGGPVSISSSGQLAGVSAMCDFRYNNVVIGAFVDYSWVFGDLEKIGINNDLTVGGRLGFIPSGTGTLLYLHAGWTQLDTDIEKFNGVKLGLGSETRLASTPFFLDLRYAYVMYDIDKVAPPGVDANSHTVRLGLNFKFEPKSLPAALQGAPGAKPCDPKMANC